MATVLEAIAAATKAYEAKNPKSKALFETARTSLPGGNTRTLLYTPPFPITITKGDGHKLIDEDGNVQVLPLISPITHANKCPDTKTL